MSREPCIDIFQTPPEQATAWEVYPRGKRRGIAGNVALDGGWTAAEDSAKVSNVQQGNHVGVLARFHGREDIPTAPRGQALHPSAP